MNDDPTPEDNSKEKIDFLLNSKSENNLDETEKSSNDLNSLI
jgi:hypothetical protein